MHHTLLKAAVLAGLSLALGTPALAWTAIKPTDCNAVHQPKILRFGGSTAFLDHDVVMNANNTRTTTRISHERQVITNAWVTTMRVYVDEFVGDGPTRLAWKWADSSTDLGTTGPISSPLTITFNNPTSLQTRMGTIRFDANGAAADRATIGRVDLCSNLSAPNTSPAALLTATNRVKGVLQGVGDVVYARVAPDAAGRHITVAVWPDDSNNRFDLHARCGGVPSETTYTARDVSPTAARFIHLAPCASDLTIAVSSQQGAGGFNLVHHFHKEAHHMRLGVGTSAEVTGPAELRGVLRDLEKGALDYFGATEGEQYIEGYDVYPNNDCKCAGGAQCQICVERYSSSQPESLAYSGGQAYGAAGPSDNSTASMKVWRSGLRGDLLIAHEFGHVLSGWLPDEYAGNRCGHSIMDSDMSRRITNMCSDFDHGYDHPGGSPSNGTSMMTLAVQAGRSMGRVGSPSPDKYIYGDFVGKFAQANVVPIGPTNASLFRIRTYTCREPGAETDASMRMMLVDSAGQTTGYRTFNGTFNQGGWDQFEWTPPLFPIEGVASIEIRNEGQGAGPDWCVRYIGITWVVNGIETRSWSYAPETGRWFNNANFWTQSLRVTEPPNDFSGDGAADFVVKNSAGDLFLIEGNGFDGWKSGAAVKLSRSIPGHNVVLTPGDWDGDGLADLISRKASDGTLWLHRGDGRGGFLGNASQIGSGWNGFNLLLAPGDYSGDGKPDILARGNDGSLHLYRGNGTGGWGSNGPIGYGWNGFDLIAAPGDFSGDGKPDLLARNGSTLSMYLSDGAGGWLNGAQPMTIPPYMLDTTAWAWNQFNALLTAGDFSGDGLVDLLGRRANGDLWLMKGNGGGGWVHSPEIIPASVGWQAFANVLAAGNFNGSGGNDVLLRDMRSGSTYGNLLYVPGGNNGGWAGDGVTMGWGWDVFDYLLGSADFDGDSKVDVMARKPDGTFWLYAGNGSGGWKTGIGTSLGTGWSWFTDIVAPGDFSGDGKADVLTRDPVGNVHLYRGNGTGGWIGTSGEGIGSGWQGFNLMLAPGDFSGDGKSDVLARMTDGSLWVARGNGIGGFSDTNAVKVSPSGFGQFETLTTPGDFTGDGKVDLIGRKFDGTMWVFKGDGKNGFVPKLVGQGWQNYDSIAGR